MLTDKMQILLAVNKDREVFQVLQQGLQDEHELVFLEEGLKNFIPSWDTVRSYSLLTY
jgi:hypothetical protein